MVETLASIAILVLLAWPSPALAQEMSLPSTELEQATRPGTIQFDRHSKHVDDQFRIYVGLPESYEEGAQESFATLYVLDANGFFETALDAVRRIESTSNGSQTIVVGVGYPVQDFRKTWALRARDYGPAPDPTHFYNVMVEQLLGAQPAENKGGGARRFLEFLEEELIPEIEAEFRVRPDDRTILGTSLGGTFALYTLFENPALFDNYIVGSPALSWGGGFLAEQERRLWAEKDSIEARVYMAIGANEGPGVAELFGMGAALRRYDALDLEIEVFEGENHISVVPLIVNGGVAAIYRDEMRE
ncbi:alpha/beta hydrolase [Erythrobacter sp. AP23]|uniref:alpha/beta hydrolase n=1 Tax=Erythrobacter sp. AP23 TaxID=499656 RepID=UPI00076C9C8F|nr:alpha/beta hydrolase-fold protein [Erythrobacter sp. AP23]KWV93774.1 hypothetical protein ASS64_12830 [Erythrobacter sp. AP23]